MELANCIITTVRELRTWSLKVAPKSAVTCTRFRDAQEVARPVRRQGFTVSAATQAAHLGIEFGCGRRGRAKRAKREKTSGYVQKIQRFTRAPRQCRAMVKLQRQGGRPAGLYGHQVHGVLGAQITQCRKRLAQTCASTSRRQCLTAVLDLRAPRRRPRDSMSYSNN